MRLTKLPLVGLVVLALVTPVAAAERSAELLDLGARIDYGFYNAEPRAIAAAVDALERLAESPDVNYFRDFAALRAAQLGERDARSARGLKACADRTPAAGDKAAEAEAWLLVAACGVVADGSGRRVGQALERARALDKSNPRIALIEAWQARAEASRDADPAVRAKWQRAVAAFDAWRGAVDAPDWGQAEALAGLAELVLAGGESRAARDLIERALWLVPDYRFAVELRSKIR